MSKVQKPTPTSVVVCGATLTITPPTSSTSALSAGAEDERATMALRGVSRCLQRAAQGGTPEAVVLDVQRRYETACAQLDAWRGAAAAFLAVPDPAEPVRLARAAAAEEIRKRLPVSFACAADASAFTAKLSFSEAAAEGAARLRQRELCDRARQVARKACWLACEAAAQLIAPAGRGSQAALDSIVEAGRYL